MRFYIQSIPHAKQRYDTLGDYWEIVPGHYAVTVSEEVPDDHKFLIIIHELIESYLARKRGIPFRAIDAFDINFEERRVKGHLRDPEGEPGDDPSAPYYREHQFASAIERTLAYEMGVDWHEYESNCINLQYDVQHPDRHKQPETELS